MPKIQLTVPPGTLPLPAGPDLAASGRAVSAVLDREDLPAAPPERRLKPVFVRDLSPRP